MVNLAVHEGASKILVPFTPHASVSRSPNAQSNSIVQYIPAFWYCDAPPTGLGARRRTKTLRVIRMTTQQGHRLSGHVKAHTYGRPNRTHRVHRPGWEDGTTRTQNSIYTEELTHPGSMPSVRTSLAPKRSSCAYCTSGTQGRGLSAPHIWALGRDQQAV